jgi:hypothetical protein
MSGFIKNNKFALLLIGISLLTISRISTAFNGGYSGNLSAIFDLLCREPIRYTLLASLGIFIFTSPSNRKHKVLLSLALVFLLSIGLIPTGHFMTLGALRSIHDANPIQVRDDARILINELEPPVHFTNYTNQRILFNEFIPKNKLPLSLQNENFNDVLVVEDKVFIEKQGICCLFRGFIVFKEGSDVWKNEGPVKLLDGCSYCWRIRIVDGLYWYHAVPTEEEINTVFHPLK